MKPVQSFTKYIHFLKKIPLYVWIISGVLIVAAFYILIFIIPKQIQFSYAGASCVNQLTLFPSSHKSQSKAVSFLAKNELKIGDWTYGATQVCIEPAAAFKEGTSNAWLSPGGLPFFARQYAIAIPAAPSIKGEVIPEGRRLSTSLPLKVGLTSVDTIHTYTLSANNKNAQCTPKDDELMCNTPKLELEQGAPYELTLTKTLDVAHVKEQLFAERVETLAPLVLKEASITADQVVYDMPKAFTLTFEKPVESGTATLKDGDNKVIATEVSTADATLKIILTNDLPRNKAFTLEVTQAIGSDGSSLAAPIRLPFRTSGGPKVASVSVGADRVALGARIAVTFDQPIAEGLDVQKIARSTGVGTVVQRTAPNQISFTLQGADQCAAFTLEIDKGVKSGSNNETSAEAWQFQSRTLCGTSWVIGHSAKGRAIIAHTFGSGASTILFTGGIHGSEPSGQATMNAFIAHLQSQAYKIPAGRKVVIVPNANPDGLASGNRYNSQGVDLNRNFPSSNWAADIQTTSGVVTGGGGAQAGSEPETAALMAITSQLRPRLMVSFHAQGRLVGANKFGDSVAIGGNYAKSVGYQTMFANPEGVMGYAITGEFEEWMGETLGVPAILIELPSHGGNYFSAHTAALWNIINL